MPATLRQIAKHANVSLMTVSRVVNGRDAGAVSSETRERVLKVADKLGYRPNVGARGLVLGKTFLAGILHSAVNYEFSSGVAGGMQNTLAKANYAPLVFTHQSKDEEMDYLNVCLARRVDGMIVNPHLASDGTTNAVRFRALADQGMPLVEINGWFIKDVPFVAADFTDAARQAVTCLLSRGHNRIALFIHDHYRDQEVRHVAGAFWNAWEFWLGYTEAMSTAGLSQQIVTYPLQNDLAASGGAFTASREGASKLFDGGDDAPTAVICMYDEAAMAVSLESQHRGGNKLQIACAGTGRAAALFPGVILSLQIPAEQIGRVSAQLLLDQLEGKRVGRAIRLPFIRVES